MKRHSTSSQIRANHGQSDIFSSFLRKMSRAPEVLGTSDPRQNQKPIFEINLVDDSSSPILTIIIKGGRLDSIETNVSEIPKIGNEKIEKLT